MYGTKCDVADRTSVQRAAKETFAGLDKSASPLQQCGRRLRRASGIITPGDWDWVMGVNLMGFVHVIQSFLPRLKEQGEGGHVVTTAS